MIAGTLAVVALLAVAAKLRPPVPRPATRAPSPANGVSPIPTASRTPTSSRTPMPTRTATRTATRPFADWATFLDTVASEVRTGHSLRAAFTAALDRHHPDGTVLRPGAGVDDLHAAASLEPDEAMAIRALVTAARLGGPMAVGLHGAAAVIREREAVRAEAAAHSAQARLSARVLTAVPLVFCAWSWCTSASFRATMSTAPGVTAATLGGILNTTGWWWMRRIVRRAAQP